MPRTAQGWTRDGAHWQGITRAVEDRLSDALHVALTQRFIDRRTSVLMKHLRDDEFASLALDEAGGVSIGGEAIGRLDGFRFVPDPRAVGIHGRTLRAAALKGLESEIAARSAALADAEDSAITLSEHGKLWWDGAIVARLVAGPSPLSPAIEMLADAHVKTDALQDAAGTLDGGAHRRAPAAAAGAARCRRRQDRHRQRPARRSARHRPSAGGEFRGAGPRHACHLPEKIGPQIRALKPFGVWFGRRTVYLPKLLRPDAAALLTLLWGVWTKKDVAAVAARAGPDLLRRRQGTPTPPRCTPAALRWWAAAPSASTCWSGWKTNWKRRWRPAAMPRHC